MAADKTRFSARVREDTLAALDDEADERDLNRSQTIDRLVEEWQSESEADDQRVAWDEHAIGARLTHWASVSVFSAVALVLAQLVAVVLGTAAVVGALLATLSWSLAILGVGLSALGLALEASGIVSFGPMTRLSLLLGRRVA
jgi:predicted phage tail protein